MTQERHDDPLHALVIGGGSIGERHASVLSDLGLLVASVSARADLPRPTFERTDTAIAEWQPAYVVIANETASHQAAADEIRAAGFTGRLLVEKPLGFVSTEWDHSPFSHTGVGFNLRFHPVLTRLARLIDGATVHTVEAYAGQALATWRPGRDPLTQYSAFQSRGGGVLRDLSHELDYLQWLFGDISGVFARGGRVAEVTVDSDDAWAMVAETSRVPIVSLHMNYLDTSARRRLVVNSSVGTIEADLVRGVVIHNGEVASLEHQRDDTYSAMHSSMLSESFAGASLADGDRVEQVVTMVERSARERLWVERT